MLFLGTLSFHVGTQKLVLRDKFSFLKTKEVQILSFIKTWQARGSDQFYSAYLHKILFTYLLNRNFLTLMLGDTGLTRDESAAWETVTVLFRHLEVEGVGKKLHGIS